MAEAKQSFDVVIIGSGPGGYVAAICAAQLGMKVGVVEEDALGGICLNWGCIPTKALLKNAEMIGMMKKLDEFGIQVSSISWDFTKAVERSRKVVAREIKGVEFLFRKNKVTHIPGRGIISSGGKIEVFDKSGKSTTQIEGKNIVIATGSRPKSIPGVSIDGKLVLSSTEAMILKELPKSITIIGGGAIGIEFAYIYTMYGVKVTIVEMLPQILPTEDQEISDTLAREFKKLGTTIHVGTKVSEIKVKSNSVDVVIESNSKKETVTSDKILIGVGRAPNTENIGLKENGIELDKGFIKVNNYLQTSKSNIYAIGDVIGNPLLAHKASAEAQIATWNIAKPEKKVMNYKLIPGCVYCQPQVASVGMTEKAAKDAGYDIAVGKFPFRANGKAIAIGEEVGMVKVVVDKKYKDILGIHIIGSEATDLISEACVLLALEATTAEVEDIVHAHPTLAEAIKEATLDAEGRAIHI